MQTLPRLNMFDWLIGAVLTTAQAAEWALLIALAGRSSPAIPGILTVSLAVLVGVILVARFQGWALDRKGIAAAVIILSAIVTAVGIAGVFFNNPPGPIVSLGFILALGFGYALFRMDRANRLASRPEEMTQAVPHGRERSTAVSATDLERIDILRALTASERALVARIARRAAIPEGAILTKAQGASNAVFGLLSGQAELHAGSALGEITVRIAQQGESFPLAALVGSQTVITDARAMTDMDVVEIPVDELRALCAQRTEIGMKVYVAIAGILADRYRVTLDRLTGSMREALGRVEFWANV